jgi:protein-arginine kinase activator protein McsA
MVHSNMRNTLCEDCNNEPATVAVQALDMETGEFLYVWHICRHCYEQGLREIEA